LLKLNVTVAEIVIIVILFINGNINSNENNNSIGNTNNNKKSNNICIFLFKLVIKSFSFNEINVLFMKNKSLQNKLFLVLMNGRDLIKFR